MHVEKQIDAKLGQANQVGLRLKCISRYQAETIHRTYRQYKRVSKLLDSTHPEFTHCIYITATTDEVTQIWLDSVDQALSAHKTSITADYVATTNQYIQKFKEWDKKFRVAVGKLYDDISSQESLLTPTVSKEWVRQKIENGYAEEAEDVLLGDIQSTAHNLRLLISLYADTQQYEKIVQLYETRKSDILALPVSDKLVKILMCAYIEMAKETDVSEMLQTARSIAKIFLPELERLQQASEVRHLLRQTITTPEPHVIELSASIGDTMPFSEKLAQLLEMEPADQLPALQKLQQNYPKSIDVHIALADAYIEQGELAQALDVYTKLPTEQANQNNVRQRRAEILLSEQQYQEVLNLLPKESDLPPALAGLRGVALANTGQQKSALPLLVQAWKANVKSSPILFTLARLYCAAEKFDEAAEPYHILLESNPDLLEAQDYGYLAIIADYTDGLGDVPYEKIATFCDTCIRQAGADFALLSMSTEVIEIREAVWKQLVKDDQP